MDAVKRGLDLPDRRSPHGERGLKYPDTPGRSWPLVSLPTRGAWIEIFLAKACTHPFRRRRSPHGERGLKLLWHHDPNAGDQSLPTRGAWIEIGTAVTSTYGSTGSLPTRGAWIEICTA